MSEQPKHRRDIPADSSRPRSLAECNGECDNGSPCPACFPAAYALLRARHKARTPIYGPSAFGYVTR